MKAPTHTGKQRLKNKLDKTTFWALSDLKVLFLSTDLIAGREVHQACLTT